MFTGVTIGFFLGKLFYGAAAVPSVRWVVGVPEWVIDVFNDTV
jgi:hypothetical protein